MTPITILGLAAAFCTTFAFLPQAIKVIRTRNTKDLSLSMYTIMTLGILLWLIYGVLSSDIPLIAANTITFIFSAIILGMKLRYK